MSPASTPAPPSKSVTIEVELARLNQEVLNFKGCRVDKRNDAVLLRELKAKVKKNKAMLETLAVSAPILICLLSQACLFRIHASRILNPPPLIASIHVFADTLLFFNLSPQYGRHLFPSSRLGSRRRWLRSVLPGRRTDGKHRRRVAAAVLANLQAPVFRPVYYGVHSRQLRVSGRCWSRR